LNKKENIMRNFRTLKIWQNAMNLVTEVYTIIESFPKHEKYGLSSQVTRSAVSIPSNIAEGCRGSNKELAQFLNISLGSSFELETQLEISKNIGFLNEEKFNSIVENINRLQKQINAYRSFIKNQH
jgi:four helix bundle protein